MQTVATIGVFDGVHRGHQALIAQTVADARSLGARSAAVTFSPNPLEVLRPHEAPARLCSIERRVELLTSLGLDHVEVLHFDQHMASMAAEVFVGEVLQDRLNVRAVIVGSGFRFGHRAAGTADTMRAAGLTVTEVDLLKESGDSVSSSRIRRAIADGEVELAASMLGRRHALTGPVVRGQGRGRQLGYPTANVELAALDAVPKDGVYAGVARWADQSCVAAISVGTNPTFGEHPRTVEAFLLDHEGDLYGQRLTVEFAHYLRPMVAFADVKELLEQMAKDVSRVQTVMSR